MSDFEQHFDSAALVAFETIVLSQKPAAKPWAPVTDYSFEARKAIEGPHAELIRTVFQPTKVLDVGCGPGHLMTLLEARGVACRGIDVNANPKWTTRDRIWQEDITSIWGPEWHDDLIRDYLTSDLVICREVLEHLTIQDIARAVTNLCALSSKYVYVTTRFAKSPQHLLDVDTSDDLDPTHISMLNQDFLRVLFVLEGFKRRADLEQRMDWKHLNRVLVYERVY